MVEIDQTGLFEDVEHGNPVFPCRFHADLNAGMLAEPTGQIPKAPGEGGKASLLVVRSSGGVRDANAGVNPGFVNVQAAAVVPVNLEHGKPPRLNWEGPH